MSVNDLLAQGAEPLFFLDYYGCSKLDVPIATQVVKGIAEGCRQSRCALIGGETAEMPGMYQDGELVLLVGCTVCLLQIRDDYDLAGFAVGAVERGQILPREDIVVGDVLLGIASSGLHSNGFSLVRKIVQNAGLAYSSPCPWDSQQTLGRFLLEPTRIYVDQVLPVAQKGLIKGISHITGGGFTENIPRILQKTLGCYVDVSSWQLPPVFKFIQSQGVQPSEMARTFNNGIGLVVVIAADNVETVLQNLKANADVPVYKIGQVTQTPGVEMRNMEMWS
jgi:phosphoribosylamine--glycine ligase/phosphoribosylformylglycinamidine cyclo-ligase